MTRKGRRMALIGGALAVLGLGVALALYALNDNIVFFFSPPDVAVKKPAIGSRLRIGGLVSPGSIVKSPDEHLNFVVSDGSHELKVSYQGLPPDLFREGQGVVAEGVLEGPALLHADNILAKHDEKYMPKEVVDSLKKSGRWQEMSAAGSAKP